MKTAIGTCARSTTWLRTAIRQAPCGRSARRWSSTRCAPAPNSAVAALTPPHSCPDERNAEHLFGNGREDDDHAFTPSRPVRLFGHLSARELRLAEWQT